MIKYRDYYIVFEEIPDKVSLAINITNCQNNCVGCHSAELKCDIGNILSFDEVDKIIKDNSGINCFLFMGEGNDKEALLKIAKYIKDKYKLSIAIYSGRKNVEEEFYNIFDYVKIGPYIEKYGPLNEVTTNQRLYKIENNKKVDITNVFWK